MAHQAAMAESKKKPRQGPIHLLFLFLFSLLSCILLFVPRSTTRLGLYPTNTTTSTSSRKYPLCSPLAEHTICCDRSSYHTDVCFMSGDIRTRPNSSSILLYLPADSPLSNSTAIPVEERIRPYTRKWEPHLMASIDELRLRVAGPDDGPPPPCDVRHDVPAVVFSAGGYTGNVFHAFNNGLIPLYITAAHLRGRAALVVLMYRSWWHEKYRDILAQISDFPPVDLDDDARTHCFPAAIVGLRFHGTLAVDPARMPGGETLADFRKLLQAAYERHIDRKKRAKIGNPRKRRPKLVVMSRRGTREMENEEEVVGLGREEGFDVEVVRPDETTPMAMIYEAVSGADAVLGVHGAALTHALFMRPGSALVQVAPLGAEEMAAECFAGAAAALGLRYEEYRVAPRESSLWRGKGGDDEAVRDPQGFSARMGWDASKAVYLDGQNVTLDLVRIRRTLARVYRSVVHHGTKAAAGPA